MAASAVLRAVKGNGPSKGRCELSDKIMFLLVKRSQYEVVIGVTMEENSFFTGNTLGKSDAVIGGMMTSLNT